MPNGKQDAFMLSDRLQQGFKKTIAIYSFLIQSVLKQMDIKIIAEDAGKYGRCGIAAAYQRLWVQK